MVKFPEVFLLAISLLSPYSLHAQGNGNGNGNGSGNGNNNSASSKLLGTVSAVPASGTTGVWTIAGTAVQVTATTTIDTKLGPAQTGACVEVTGTPGTPFVATKVDVQPAGRCGGGSGNGNGNGSGGNNVDNGRIEITGQIETLPASGLVGDWKVATRNVSVTNATKLDQFRGPAVKGACVRVAGTVMPDAVIKAQEIEVLGSSAGCAAGVADNAEISFRGLIQEATGQGSLVISGRKVSVVADSKVEPTGWTPRVNDCVDVDGVFGDGVVIAKRLQRLGSGVCANGPAEEDSLRFTGQIRSMPPNAGTGDWLVGSYKVLVNAQTWIGGNATEIRVGACVEVQGSMDKDVVLAAKIRPAKPSDCQSSTDATVSFMGVATAVPQSSTGDFTIGGRTVRVTAQTEVSTFGGPVAIGACIEATGTVGANDVFLATKLEVKSASGMCIVKGGVVSSASFTGLSVTPGQILAIFGMNIGPATQVPLEIDDGRLANRLANTRVLFDGVAAPLLYATRGQINAVVPCSVAGKTSVVVQVESNGGFSNTVTLPVENAAPSIFTLSNSGQGRGAILNFDQTTGKYTENSPSNPAARGSLVSIYFTGAGVTDPPCVDGSITGSTVVQKPVLPVKVEVGGATAQVEFVGSAPGNVFGVFQANVRLSSETEPGPNQPVTITIGGKVSQAGVTIAVK